MLIQFALALVSPSAVAALPSLPGRAIMNRQEEARKVADFTADARLSVQEKGAAAKTKDFTFWRKTQSDGVHYRTLTRFHAPAEVRDEGILFLERSSGENDVLLYLPAYKKIRRVETQQQSSSFMGSDFSYSDIATPHVDDYTYGVARTEKCPSEEAAALECYVVEAKPANDAILDRTGYSKSLVWIRGDNYMPAAAEYYDRDGKLLKKMLSDKTATIATVGGAKKWLNHRMRIENVKTGSTTTLEFSKAKANAGVADSLFTQQNLSNVR